MKAGNLTDPVIEGLVTGRQHLQREHFATLLRAWHALRPVVPCGDK
jgi:hypothetical protein